MLKALIALIALAWGINALLAGAFGTAAVMGALVFFVGGDYYHERKKIRKAESEFPKIKPED